MPINQVTTPAVTQIHDTGVTAPETNNKRAQALYDANPYRKYTYKNSFLQNLASALGFRTNADSMREQMVMQAQEYDSAISQKLQDEMYNTPSEMASRMRQAGLNPDILGIGDASAASPSPEDTSVPNLPQGDEINPSDAFNAVANIVSSSLLNFVGISKQMQELKSISLANEKQQFDVFKSRFDFALSAYDSLRDYNGSYELPSTLTKYLSRGMNKRQASAFASSVSDFYSSITKDKSVSSDIADIASSNRKYVEDSSLPGMDDSLQVAVDSLRFLNSKRREFDLSLAESQKEKSDFEKEYYNTLNGEEKARAENFQNSYDIALNQERVANNVPQEQAKSESEHYKSERSRDAVMRALTPIIDDLSDYIQRKYPSGLFTELLDSSLNEFLSSESYISSRSKSRSKSRKGYGGRTFKRSSISIRPNILKKYHGGGR